MNRQTLAILEEAVEPYRRAGFVITSQSEGSITLAYPRVKFSYLLFILLLLIWPLAILYLISFNNQREKSVCLRVTSQGRIEDSGYTLAIAERDRKRERIISYTFLIITIVALIFFILLLTGNL